jgi:hypothetical protein
MATKTKTLAKVLDDTAVLMQKYVRLKDFVSNGGFCKCVTCGKTGHWKEFDGGHFISRTYTIHKILEKNIHPQCKGCNRFGHKCHDDYSMYMIDNYGEDFVRELIDTKRISIKRDRQELLATQKDLKQKIKDLENEVPTY